VNDRATNARVEIRALGTWEVLLDGKRRKATEVRYRILQALVLAQGQVHRDDLFELIGWGDGTGKAGSFKTMVSALNQLPGITVQNGRIVTLEADEAASIDLWEFLRLAKDERTAVQAARLIAGGKRPRLLLPDVDERNDLWVETFDQFDAAADRLSALVGQVEAASRFEDDPVVTQRERLVNRRVTGRLQSGARIETTFDRVRHLRFPWRRGDDGPVDQQITEAIADALERQVAQPRRAVLIGPPGAGKRLAGIMTYVELADRYVERGGGAPVPIHVDGVAVASERDFPGREWHDRTLAAWSVVEGRRAIAVMTRADAYLARHADDLDAILGAPLFHDTDVLLCCSDRFYYRHLVDREYATDVFELVLWSFEHQMEYAEAAYGTGVSRLFERAMRRNKSLARLCRVPFHLVLVLEQIASDGKLVGVSNEAQLFARVARHRLTRVPAAGPDVDEELNVLASVAYEFYVDARANVASAVRLPRDGLVRHLRNKHGYAAAQARELARTLESESLLVASDNDDDLLQFEDTTWGWYFVARHISHTLRDGERDVLSAFAKFLSPEVALFFEQMLRDALKVEPDHVLDALRACLLGDGGSTLDPRRRRVARQQVAYFLGAVGDARVREELMPLLDLASDHFERDPWVRRGVLSGLADGGLVAAADQFVEGLRTEIAANGATPERNCNIGFLLTFRGDQPFDPSAPDVIHGASCTKTVAQLVRGLRETDRPAGARIRLFSLLDLGRHPSIDQASWADAIADNVVELKAIHGSLVEQGRNWPEVVELRAVLDASRQ
jgi:hypothetical protein